MLHHPRVWYIALITRGLTLVLVLFVLLYTSDLLDFTSRRFDTWAWNACPKTLFDKSCQAPRSKLVQDVQVILRTGGSEPLSRIRSHLSTVLYPIPPGNVVVFSDLEETLGGVHIQDAYTNISKEELHLYPEFALYDIQQEYQDEGKDTRELQGGWILGKYMNLPMKRKIWEMQQELSEKGLPRKKWFVFVETDTFIEWENLFELLSHLDATKPVYIGSPVWLDDVIFAHGKNVSVLRHPELNGYVLSPAPYLPRRTC